MLDAIKAEWVKTAGNRWVVGFLIWIFPLGAAIFMGFLIILALLAESVRPELAVSVTPWTGTMLSTWSFPSNILGRMFLISFATVAVGGEYVWGTWKNVIPHNRRVNLILAKFVVVGILVLLAFTLMSLLLVLGNALLAQIVDVPFGPPLSRQLLADFLPNYSVQLLLAMMAVFLAVAYATIAAMLTRSIVGGILVGLGITIGEPLIFVILMLAAGLLDRPRLVHLVRLTPFYHLDNVSNWLSNDAPTDIAATAAELGPTALFTDSMNVSIAALVVTAVLITAFIVHLFNRQDITT